MKTIILLAVLMAACAPALIARDKDKKEKICITEQEFAVYHAVGVENYENETSGYPFFDGAEHLFPNISPDLVADYRDKNSKSYLLRCLLRKDLKKKNLKRYYGGTSTTGFSESDSTEARLKPWFTHPGPV